ncbi:MAG: hypothetical protein ABIH24_01805, partial [Verrucomicrobiota bacterium]
NLVESNPPLIQFIRSFYFSPVFRPDIITELNLKSRAFQHQRILKRCATAFALVFWHGSGLIKLEKAKRMAYNRFRIT